MKKDKRLSEKKNGIKSVWWGSYVVGHKHDEADPGFAQARAWHEDTLIIWLELIISSRALVARTPAPFRFSHPPPPIASTWFLPRAARSLVYARVNTCTLMLASMPSRVNIYSSNNAPHRRPNPRPIFKLSKRLFYYITAWLIYFAVQVSTPCSIAERRPAPHSSRARGCHAAWE